MLSELLSSRHSAQTYSIIRNDRCLCERSHCRALDPLPDTASSIADLVDENRLLRTRIEQLEALLAVDQSAGRSPISTSSANDKASTPQPPEDIVAIFEGLHLGHPVNTQPRSLHISTDVSVQHVLSLLPIRQSSLKIVRFSLAALGWVHCALNGPRFLAEHDAFWNSLGSNDQRAMDNHGWMAVYFSVLAVSLASSSYSNCPKILDDRAPLSIFSRSVYLLMLIVQGRSVLSGRQSCRRHPLHPRRLLWSAESCNGALCQWTEGHLPCLV